MRWSAVLLLLCAAVMVSCGRKQPTKVTREYIDEKSKQTLYVTLAVATGVSAVVALVTAAIYTSAVIRKKVCSSSQCGFSNDPSARFCRRCGKPLTG